MDRRILGVILMAIGAFFIWCAANGYDPKRVVREYLKTGTFDKKVVDFQIEALGIEGKFVPVPDSNTQTPTPGGTPQVVPA